MKNVAPVDDLLKVVSPNLLAGYEKRHDGVSLLALNEEYRAMILKGDPGMIIFKVITLLFWVTVFSLVWVIFASLQNMPTLTVIGPAMIATGTIVFYLCIPFSRREREHDRITRKCQPLLEEFRKAVDGLNPCHVTVREYTPESVRDILIGLAARIIEAEHKFDAVRQQKERRTYDVLHLGNWLVGCQEDLMRARRCALEFDLDFSNSELFAKAGERIEQTNLLLASQK